MKPLILDFKEKRTENEFSPVYEYDRVKSINLVKVKGKLRPFIDLKPSDLAVSTVTKVAREQDDNHFFSELTTKTEVSRERDDRPNTLLELATKTFTNRESEDQNSSYYK